MRLIDADVLDKSIRDWYCAPERCDNYNGVRCRACSIDDALSELDSAPTIDAEPVRQWISVKDRLPEEKGWYLVYAPAYKGSPSPKRLRNANGRMLSRWTGKHWNLEDGYYMTQGTIEYWTLIAEPPKEDEHEAD